MHVKPITPDEMRDLQKSQIHPSIMEAINYLLMERLGSTDKSTATLYYPEIIQQVMRRGYVIPGLELYDAIEKYRSNGWRIDYTDKLIQPKDESHWTFTIPEK